MERQNHSALTGTYGCSLLVIIFHAVGLAGFLIPALSPLFLKLVPFHLAFMFVLIVLDQQERPSAFWLFVCITIIAGYSIEWLGISTGLIFGQYQYGSTLGYKLADVPVIIGLNWVLLIYSVAALLQSFRVKNRLVKAAYGATLLVMLDVLIEPVAIRFDYWYWQGSYIPLQNYATWFVFSFLMLLFLYRFKFSMHNRAAITLFITQMLFFAMLNLWAL